MLDWLSKQRTRSNADFNEYTSYPNFVTGNMANYNKWFRWFENCGSSLRHKHYLYGYKIILKKGHNSGTIFLLWLPLTNILVDYWNKTMLYFSVIFYFSMQEIFRVQKARAMTTTTTTTTMVMIPTLLAHHRITLNTFLM